MEVKINNNFLELTVGNIVEQSDIDVIVNAANKGLLGGGGVDWVVHEVGGLSLLEECKYIRNEVLKGDWLHAGGVVITGAGNLPNKKVIHAVGPIWRINKDESSKLKSVYIKSLELAQSEGFTSIAFPSISTGIFRCPIKWASNIAIKTIIQYLNNNNFGKVRMVLFTDEDYKVYEQTLKKRLISN